MKHIILVLLLFAYSCEEFVNQKEIHIYGCEIDEDCIARIGKNYVCQDKSCKYDYCKTLNGYAACNHGECRNIHNGYICDCPINEYSKRPFQSTTYFNIDKCISDISCEKASDCDFLMGNNTFYSVCSATENKCVTHCENDFDCKGEYAKCSNEQPDFNQCADLKELYNQFINAPKFDEYCQDSFFDPYTICGKHCETNSDCNTGFICNLDKKCLPICANDQDCENDKFSDGNICDTNLNHCVKE